MTDNDPIDNDPIERLRSVDRFSTVDASDIQPPTGFDTLFEEITMIEEPQTTTMIRPLQGVRTLLGSIPEPKLSSSSRYVFGGIVATVVLVSLVAVAASVMAPNPEPIASAQPLTDAAETTAEQVSGRIDIEADFTGTSAFHMMPQTWESVTVYDGADFRSTGEGYETINVDGVWYRWFQTDGSVSENTINGENSETESGVPTREQDRKYVAHQGSEEPLVVQLDTIIALLVEADDFVPESLEDDVATFTGTVNVSELQDQSDKIPTFIADQIIEENPLSRSESITLAITIKDGVLAQIEMTFTGDLPEGVINGTTSATYSELGEPQDIQAPSEDAVLGEVPNPDAPAISENEQIRQDLERSLNARVEAGEITERERDLSLRSLDLKNLFVERRPGECELLLLPQTPNNGLATSENYNDDVYEEESVLQGAQLRMERIEWMVCMYQAGEEDIATEYRSVEVEMLQGHMPAELIDAEETLFWLYVSRPELCRGERTVVADGVTVGDGVTPIEDLEEYQEVFAVGKARFLEAVDVYQTCLVDAGEPEAAAAAITYWIR